MAGDVPANLWSTYDVGYAAGSANREDLADIVTIISPAEVPGFSTFGKTTAKLRTHEWLVDALSAVSTAGAGEGADFGGNALETRLRLNNVTQIFRKDIIVSDTQQEVDPAGVRNEYEYQVMKGMKELSRNVEASIFKVATGGITGTEATAAISTMKGLRGFTTLIASGGGANVTADIVGVHQLGYAAGAVYDSLWMSPGIKAAFTIAVVADGAANVRNIAANDNRLTANIEMFQTPFGLLPVIVDRFIPQATATNSSGAYFLIEKSKVRLAMLRPFKHVPLAKGGDSTRGFLRGELTVEVLHPSCVAMVTGVTAAGTTFGV